MDTSLFSRADLRASVTHDYEVMKHLLTKMPQDTLDYKPTDGQRTMQELIEYLAMMPYVTVRVIRAGSFDEAKPAQESLPAVDVASFDSYVDDMLAKTFAEIDEMTDEELAGEVDLFGNGQTQSRRTMLINFLVKFSASYKMQLFLYIKAAGVDTIKTPNLWLGIDPA